MGSLVAMTNDVEKRWHDPVQFRAAVTYTAAVVVVAGIAFALYLLLARGSMVAASTVPGLLFLGGLGAFGRTLALYRSGGTWPIWQGAGWFLLTLMLVCLAVPGTAA